MSTHRPERIAEKIHGVLARRLRELRDPRIGFVTITDVRMSPDLKHAWVYVSILDDDAQPSFDALQHAVPFLRRTLAREAGLRYTPQLHVEIDASIATGFQVEQILDDLHDEERPDEPDSSVDEEQR